MIANQDFTASATLTLGAMALFQPSFAKYYQKAIFLNSGHSVFDYNSLTNVNHELVLVPIPH